MAKTQWPTSSPFGFITPALQKLWWGDTAGTGHNHQGLDEDGSCPNISSDDATNDSTVSGTKVSGALEYLDAAKPNATSGFKSVKAVSGTNETSVFNMQYFGVQITASRWMWVATVDDNSSMQLDCGAAGSDNTYKIIPVSGTFPWKAPDSTLDRIEVAYGSLHYNGSSFMRPGHIGVDSAEMRFYLYDGSNGYADNLFTGIAWPGFGGGTTFTAQFEGEAV